jgi:hypothetical protein
MKAVNKEIERQTKYMTELMRPVEEGTMSWLQFNSMLNRRTCGKAPR